jgi:hypothetical protein
VGGFIKLLIFLISIYSCGGYGWFVVKKRVSVVVLVVALVVLVALCVISVVVSYTLLERSGYEGSIVGKVHYWFTSALYMLLFAVFALLLILVISLIVHIAMESIEDKSVWSTLFPSL